MARILRLCKRLFVCIAVLLLTIPAYAGEWKELDYDGSWNKCSHEFSGKINRGDMIDYLMDLESRKEGVWRLCLNSTGGSLEEVLEVVKNYSFSTRVKSGDECSSACAVLFMFGLSFGANSPRPDRVLEPGARLGFHSPFITIDRKVRVGAKDAFKVAIEISKLLADRSYTTITYDGPAVPPELLALMLGTPADQMYYVNRVGELQLLSIETTWSDGGKTVRVNNSREDIIKVLTRICVSSFALTFRRSLTEDGYSFDDLLDWIRSNSSEIEVHHLNHVPVEGDLAGRYEGLLTGPFSHPHWNSAGAQMYCQPTIAYKPSGDKLDVTDSYVDFDLLFSRNEDMSTIPAPTEAYKEVVGGLIPLDTIYAE